MLDYLFQRSQEIPPYPTPDPIEQGECGNNYVVAGMDSLPIVSPGFPDQYLPNLDCYWFFHTTWNASIIFELGYVIEFFEKFAQKKNEVAYLKFLNSNNLFSYS